MSDIRVIAGLGNPGPRYSGTRHNFGFALLDKLAGGALEKIEVLSSWKSELKADLCELRIDQEKIWLVKPLSFMNRSGEPLAALMNFYKFEAPELVVVHDELDLVFGQMRLKKGGGSAGHNGLRSIEQGMGSPDFYRLRLGIGSPGAEQMASPQDWVLSRFSAEETSQLESLLDRGVEALLCLIRDGLVSAQNKFND